MSAASSMPVYQFAYRRSPDQERCGARRHPVVIVGAGPVGLTLAIDLAQRNVPVVLLDDSDRIGEGSRAICFAKKTLEIFDRLGVAEPMLARGVRWSVGRVFRGEGELYRFDLLPEGGHKMPAFINLQQYHVEKALVDRADALPEVDLRWKNRVTAVRAIADGATIDIETPDGPYTLEASWLIACDGARSPVRGMLALPFAGEVFDDQFLIADVKMTADFPVERWFWFDPPFHDGQSALLHKQPDDIWRIDLQLGRDADAEQQKRPDIVIPRIEAMLGHRDFALEWVSVYRFQCRRLGRFVHDRVIFAGDAAHQVSPFGARGANSGVQDAENLAWKLALVVKGEAGADLIETYNEERSLAADENILNSTRSTDFLAPQSKPERILRDAVLDLARDTGFAKRMVNSGRLSTPSAYGVSDGAPASVGAPIPDAPLIAPGGDQLYLSEALGRDFTLLINGAAPVDAPAEVRVIGLVGADAHRDPEGLLVERLALIPGAAVLVRPDAHVAARTSAFTAEWLSAALAFAKGKARNG